MSIRDLSFDIFSLTFTAFLTAVPSRPITPMNLSPYDLEEVKVRSDFILPSVYEHMFLPESHSIQIS